MKKMIFSAIALLAATFVQAQETTTSANHNEWLASFTAVVVNAPANVEFIKSPDSEAPKIVYDTKGSLTTKFSAEVRDKVLYVRERTDANRTERTTVKIYYSDLQSVKLTDATVTFDGAFSRPQFDLTVGEGARLTAALDVKDLKADISGRSETTLTGQVRYLTLTITTGKLDATGLECMSAQVHAQTKASVSLYVTERLEAKASTNATVLYKGKPSLIRNSSGLFAGTLRAVE